MGDLDGDGFTDLILNGAQLFRGTPAGIERTPSWWGSLDTPWPAYQRGADFDGDGRRELTSLSLAGLIVREVTP